jgi:hypothetical protein
MERNKIAGKANNKRQCMKSIKTKQKDNIQSHYNHLTEKGLHHKRSQFFRVPFIDPFYGSQGEQAHEPGDE